ncbi:MAG: ABC transporter permease [Firmicutes bacterium]|nr:ABC transporter permease [Bacillota bacterium]
MANRQKSIGAGRLIRNNAVTLLFIALSVGCVLLSGMRLTALAYELVGRIARNAFIILALIIPIVAGMGINFAITIGAMAAQIAILLTMNWYVSGILGFILACGLTIPLAALFGLLIGLLLNKMKGQEMFGSMILGFFATGFYQLLFLYIFGALIPIANPDLTIVGATGVRNSLDLSVSYGFKLALDNVWKLQLAPAVYWSCGILAGIYLIMFLFKRTKLRMLLTVLIASAVCVLAVQCKFITDVFALTRIPMATVGMVALLCAFNVIIMRTRLGQRFRAVGQNRAVANAAGINVNRTRIIAIVLSTVLAGLGQVIYMQNFGVVQTYSAHEQVGLYAGAAILVGGASIVRATNGQAILGCLLFHALFIVAPQAAKTIFGRADIEEFFRRFMSYGVIALALVLHGLRSRKTPEDTLKDVTEKG